MAPSLLGNSPLRSQSSEWIGETAVAGIAVPAHSGQAAGHRAGKPANRKQHQIRKRTTVLLAVPESHYY